MSASHRTFPNSARWSAGRAEAAALAVAALFASAGGAEARTPACVVSTAPVAFGAYDASAGSPTTSSGYVDVQCTCATVPDCTDVYYNLEIQAGGSGSLLDRRMVRSGGTETLRYTLYQDSNHSTPWTTGFQGVSRNYPMLDFGTPQRTSVYGRMPAGQYVPAGTYGETPPVAVIY